MDDFQPEDELKPDTSDRPAPRGKKPAPSSKLPISKQHIMIAVGILVLLLLVLGIGSAMNSSSKPNEGATAQGNERNIDLSGNASADNSSAPANDQQQPVDTQSAASSDTTSNGSTETTNGVAPETQPSAEQASVASLPTAAATLDRNAKLSNTTQVAQQPVPTDVTPTQPVHRSAPNVHHARPEAPVTHTEPRQVSRHSEERHLVSEHRETVSHRQPEHSEAKRSVAPREPVKTVEKQAPVTTSATSQPAKVTPAPVAPSREAVSGKGYTLQLSGASREDTLNAWAKKQNLSSYQVYKTSRNGQAWYVLTTGNYKTPAEAKSAISSLPEAVKAKSPWVKPMSQVRQESAQ